MEMKYHKWDADENLVTLVDESEWEYQPYPETDLVSRRSGIKVGWRTYSTIESADACAYAAAINAVLQERQGYDFGYLIPSTITQVGDNWEVVIP